MSFFIVFYGALPHTPLKELFANILAYARGKFAYGEVCEVPLESSKTFAKSIMRFVLKVL
jgi:hypothetical protein